MMANLKNSQKIHTLQIFLILVHFAFLHCQPEIYPLQPIVHENHFPTCAETVSVIGIAISILYGRHVVGLSNWRSGGERDVGRVALVFKKMNNFMSCLEV